MAMVIDSTIDRMLAKARFQMRAASGLQIAFLTFVTLAGLFSPVGILVGQIDVGPFAIIVAGFVWFLLVMRSLQQGQLMRQASILISQGRASQAIPFLAMTIEQFSVFRLPKLIALQHLMEMAYARKEYAAAQRLAGEIVRYGLARRKGLTSRACLVLADSLLELGETEAAGQALSWLHGRKLTMSQRLQLLPILLRWQMIEGKYAQAVDNLEEKVHLAALLNCEQACLVHVLLAAAAGFRGMKDVSQFLLRRACLHYNLDALARDYPSVARYLVQLQSSQHDRLTSVAGRTAYAETASQAVSRDVQSTDNAAESLGEHVYPAASDCDRCAHS